MTRYAGNFAHLREECPFRKFFAHGMAPITNVILPSRVDLEGSSETDAYMLDLAKVGDETLNAIMALIAERANADPAIVMTEIKRNGLPIRASQVSTVSSDSRFVV